MSSDGNEEARPSDQPGVDVRRLGAQMVSLHAALAVRLGLNDTDLKILDLVIGERLPITPGRLAELTGLTTGAITGVLDRLEQAGIVRREVDADDRRRMIIRLVPERAVEITAAYQPLEKLLNDLLARYDDRARTAIADFTARAGEILQAEAAKMRPVPSAAAWSGRGDFSVPLGGATSGRLVFATGAAKLEISAGTAADELCRARFGGAAPEVRAADGTITIGYRRRGLERIFDWSAFSAWVALGPAVPWIIEVRGGMSSVNADLRHLRLAGLDFRGGVSDIALRLPQPSRNVSVRISGGASKIVIHRPAGAQVRVSAGGGFAALTLDGRHVTDQHGTSAVTQGWADARDRYDIAISGGASKIAVDTR